MTPEEGKLIKKIGFALPKPKKKMLYDILNGSHACDHFIRVCDAMGIIISDEHIEIVEEYFMNQN